MISLRLDEVELPNGAVSTREIVVHPGAVAVVPLCEDGRVIMVRQYRHAAGQVLLEIPAGKLDEGEDPVCCAARELEEETGYQASVLRHLSTVYTTPGFTDEIMHIYAAQGLTPAKQRTDEDEFIDIEILTPAQLKYMLSSGEIRDAKTQLGLYLAGVLI
ncbi:MAG: NUDIX hydrolase [Negativicutes bacterium]|nr:NUDIX hydrolase [Negativicutes bacterium]